LASALSAASRDGRYSSIVLFTIKIKAEVLALSALENLANDCCFYLCICVLHLCLETIFTLQGR
jgi:hypothetical protein